MEDVSVEKNTQPGSCMMTLFCWTSVQWTIDGGGCEGGGAVRGSVGGWTSHQEIGPIFKAVVQL